MTRKNRLHTMGEGGECVCPKCETLIAHKSGVPCQEERCPKCNAKMLRVGSEHHGRWQQMKSAKKPV